MKKLDSVDSHSQRPTQQNSYNDEKFLRNVVKTPNIPSAQTMAVQINKDAKQLQRLSKFEEPLKSKCFSKYSVSLQCVFELDE